MNLAVLPNSNEDSPPVKADMWDGGGVGGIVREAGGAVEGGGGGLEIGSEAEAATDVVGGLKKEDQAAAMVECFRAAETAFPLLCAAVTPISEFASAFIMTCCLVVADSALAFAKTSVSASREAWSSRSRDSNSANWGLDVSGHHFVNFVFTMHGVFINPVLE